MSHPKNDEYYEALQEWLDLYERKSQDLLQDKKGKYIIVEREYGTPGEEADFTESEKIYLPDNFQNYDGD